MSTADQVTGSALGSQATANAALAMLIRLGHADVLDQIKAEALEVLNNSINAAPSGQFDKDAALEAGRQTIFRQFVNATVTASLGIGKGQLS